MIVSFETDNFFVNSRKSLKEQVVMLSAPKLTICCQL